MLSKENILSLSVVLIFLHSSGSVDEIDNPSSLHRVRRQLLFPNSTLLQFNAGLGFPSAAKNINVNYAFQANFQLPWNRSQIPIDILEANSGYLGDARTKRDAETESERESIAQYHDDAKLYYFYKHVEDVLTGFGHSGKVCVLHTLCQLGAEPLHSDDEEDLLHEMATFVLNPTHDAQENMTEKDEAYPYIKAYTNGQNGQHCNILYKGCSLSLIDIFTKLHDVS